MKSPLSTFALVCLMGTVASPGVTPPPGDQTPDSHNESEAEGRRGRTGLLRHEPGAFTGYTLFAPIRSTTTYLINMKGEVVHSWKSDAPPGQAVCLLDNGNLLRAEHMPGNRAFHGGGLGGRIREYAWTGEVIWEFAYANDRHMQHHDFEPLPNGNVLLIAWEKKSKGGAVAAGRDPTRLGPAGLWPDHIVEVKPTRPRGGTIVWEWHVWDHLIQDHDPTKASFGVVADHPELIDINFDGRSMRLTPEERRRLEALGYMVPAPGPHPPEFQPDWNHTNSVAYNAELDQIALSVLGFNEIWVIDHSTTTEEAAGHTGGRSGKGGDILYRWGNPRAYRAGTAADQQLFAQHDARWIPPGFPGAGNLLVFNNGRGRPGGEYSSVDEIIPPIGTRGQYVRRAGQAFGPVKPTWIYAAAEKRSFYSGHISGAERLPNGNTLICSGETGRFVEVDPGGNIVWEYVNPLGGDVPERPPAFLPGFVGRLLPPMGPGGPPPKPPGKRPGPPPGPPGQRPKAGGPRWPRPPGAADSSAAVFRVTRLASDNPGLADKKLGARGGP